MDYQNQKALYENFILKEAYEQKTMQLYIEEAIGFTSGTITRDELYSLNEKFTETAKEKLKALWEKIKEIFRKVVNGISNFFMGKQSFLEKNKDIILEKKVTYQEEFELYDYDTGIKRMGQTKIKPFNYNEVRNKIDTKDFSKTLHDYFGFNQFQCSKEDLLDIAKDYFRGGDTKKDYKNTELNMTNMYNYCIDYKEKILKSLESDQNVIAKSYDNIIKALGKVETTKQSTSNESTLFNDQPIYSNFLEAYIYEADEEMTSGPGHADPDEDKDKEGVYKAGSYIKQNKMEKGKDEIDADKMKTDLSHNKEEKEKFNDQCNEYMDVANYITQAKLAVAKEISEEYFKIIKAHVKSYNGQAKDDKEGDKGKATGTDYNADLSPAAKKALENQKEITNVIIRYGDANENGKDGNKYFIRIFIKDNNPIDQSVETHYNSKIDEHKRNGLIYIENSIDVVKEKGIWKIKRTFDDQANGKKIFKTLYIDPSKSPAADGNFKEENKIQRGDNK